METMHACPECGSTNIERAGKKVVDRCETPTEILDDYDDYFLGDVSCVCFDCSTEWVVSTENKLKENRRHRDGFMTDIAYVRAGANLCPYCQSDDITREGRLVPLKEGCSTRKVETAYCNECGEGFYELWECVGYNLYLAEEG